MILNFMSTYIIPNMCHPLLSITFPHALTPALLEAKMQDRLISNTVAPIALLEATIYKQKLTSDPFVSVKSLPGLVRNFFTDLDIKLIPYLPGQGHVHQGRRREQDDEWVDGGWRFGD